MSPKVGKFSEQVWGKSGERQHRSRSSAADSSARSTAFSLSFASTTARSRASSSRSPRHRQADRAHRTQAASLFNLNCNFKTRYGVSRSEVTLQPPEWTPAHRHADCRHARSQDFRVLTVNHLITRWAKCSDKDGLSRPPPDRGFTGPDVWIAGRHDRNLGETGPHPTLARISPASVRYLSVTIVRIPLEQAKTWHSRCAAAAYRICLPVRPMSDKAP